MTSNGKSCLALRMKIIPHPISSIWSSFWAKGRNAIHFNLEPSRRPPLPVCNRGRPNWLIRYNFYLREGGCAQKTIFISNTLDFTSKFYKQRYVRTAPYKTRCRLLFSSRFKSVRMVQGVVGTYSAIMVTNLSEASVGGQHLTENWVGLLGIVSSVVTTAVSILAGKRLSSTHEAK